MNNFIYNIPVKVYFGENQLCNLGPEILKYGRKILLVYGSSSIRKMGLYDEIIAELSSHNISISELPGIEPNPKIDAVRKGVLICKREKIDVVLAAGGGSTIDTAKYIAAGACVDHDSWDFFSQKAPIEKALPVIDIPTLSATGSEMDCCGVISNPESHDKIARQNPVLFPKVSFLNPCFTFSVDSFQTACGSVDMMSHIMEVYFNINPDFCMLDSFMEGMMKSIIHFTPIAINEPTNYEARANLMWISSWAINGFINGGKRQSWSCHPMEHELSAFYNITHGLGLAILIPKWLEYCLDESTIPKYVQFGTNVFGMDPALPDIEIAEQSILLLKDFFYITLKLKSTFGDIGIDNKNFSTMSKKAVSNGQLSGFKTLTQSDVEKIYTMCL